jgi:DNA-binding NarL/FixJ family response regulator
MSIAARLTRLDLLLADFAMAEMTGPELAEWLGSSRPGLKILLASPFDEDQASLPPALGIGFLRKPYTPGSLSRAVRAALDTEPLFSPGAPRSRRSPDWRPPEAPQAPSSKQSFAFGQ